MGNAIQQGMGITLEEDEARTVAPAQDMTSRQITAVSLRCLAIYLLFTALAVLPVKTYAIWRTASEPSMHLHISSMSLIIVVVIICGLVTGFFGLWAWRLSNAVACPKGSTPEDSLHLVVTPQRLETFLFPVLGVYLASDSLTTLFRATCSLMTWTGDRNEITDALRYQHLGLWWNLFGTLTMIAFGTFLALKPMAFIGLLDRLKAMGKTNTGQI